MKTASPYEVAFGNEARFAHEACLRYMNLARNCPHIGVSQYFIDGKAINFMVAKQLLHVATQERYFIFNKARFTAHDFYSHKRVGINVQNRGDVFSYLELVHDLAECRRDGAC